MNTAWPCRCVDADVRRVSSRRSSFHPLAVLALALALCTATTLGAQQPQEPLENDDLVDMTKAGIDENTIVTLVEGSRTDFDTSAAALIALKNASVSDRVIAAVVSIGRPKASRPPNGLYPQPEEVGVYAHVRERLVPLKSEIITWRSGGVLKQALLSRGHLNAVVTRPMSTLRLDSRPEFIVYCAVGVSPEEYQLLRLWTKRDRREFRLATGGVLHASSGAEMNAVSVDLEMVGTRLYRITPTLPLPEGEYGFLPPGAALSASAASAGKIHTFGIVKAQR